MVNISYTITPFLIRYEEKLEHFRRSILIAIISPKAELSLQFEATISRIYFMLKMADENVTKEEIKKIITNQMHFTSQLKTNTSSQNPLHVKVLRYKTALDYIQKDWLVSDKIVTVDALLKLHTIVSPGRLRVSKDQLQEVLDYLELAKDNSYIQAAIAKLVFKALEPFTDGNAVFSTLTSYLFLYKAGLDYRRLLVLEEAWAKNMLVYNGQYKTALKKTNITSWIEYFVRSASTQLEEAYQKITKDPQGHHSMSEKISELNDRQKAILNLLNDPAATITNRDVQRIFNISQITASRDLAKLATLTLLLIHGKGRSIRYTKV